MGNIIGIDLGTTTSEVAYIKDGHPVIIGNEKYCDGNIMPSVVTIKKDEIIVGKKAKRQMLIRPEITVSEIKRLMGTNEKIVINEKEYLPQQISAIILKELKEMAEEQIGKVDEAVITVPANFNDIQRAATKEAAQIAGLKVERIINEPTAAAMYYGLENIGKEAKILVYDLGGGTFDCTVLELFSGIMDVKASRGDNLLGGKDFDNRIEEYILEYISKNTEVNIEKLSKKKKSEIKETAEEAKKDLSVSNSTDIIINNLGIDKEGESIDIEFEFSRDRFNQLTKDLIEKTEVIVGETLLASGITGKDIDIVLLVGGSSRMVAVSDMLKKSFGDKIISSVNADEAVALGAAVQAGIKDSKISSESGLIVTDVCSYTLGVAVEENEFSPIIKRDMKLPIIKSEIYVTSSDDQERVNIRVYQGEEKLTDDNMFVGNFVIDGIPKKKAGEEKVEVTFEYDLNGMLDVSVEVLSTGKKKHKLMAVERLNEKDIEDLSKDINIKQKNLTWKDSELYNIVSVSISVAKDKFEKMDSKTLENVNSIISEMKTAIENEDKDKVTKLDDTLTDILFDID
ncbi:Hsp70 family protein [Clostridium thermobutyricum]|uniref:Chaperone protein DnaK n=1 Tax=Clostridium thermobutyricum DSM 4928 TaxID=1121339 RepID=A0A1V4SZX2_9CLOT|nr:Hsp70 family protein [Clostridium thermobutyricum]OPX50393.1 chaperone protein DnaK [Clostridium thermobutyricum DSM 4928]